MGFYRDRIFPLLSEAVSSCFEEDRKFLLKHASGDVLEVGFGSGISVRDYPESVSRLVGLEPSAGMRDRARSKSGVEPLFPLELIEGVCERLPFDDQCFDIVVSIVTLCSVNEPAACLREIRRVLRNTGSLLFLEHGVQPNPCLTRAIQLSLSGVWRKATCGCNLNREPLTEIVRAGFHINELRVIGYNGFPNLISPIHAGVASLD